MIPVRTKRVFTRHLADVTGATYVTIPRTDLTLVTTVTDKLPPSAADLLLISRAGRTLGAPCDRAFRTRGVPCDRALKTRQLMKCPTLKQG